MAVFMVDAEKAKGNASTIKSQKRTLQSYSRQIISVANQIRIGNEDRQLKKQLRKISEFVNENAKDCENLGNALIEIISLYQKTEKEIVDGKFNKESAATGKNSTEKNDGKSDKQTEDQQSILDKLKEKFNLSDIAMEALKLILGIIPGVNCLIDMYDLVKDLSGALEDGKLSAGEIFTLALDTFSLVADVASFGALLKSMEGVADGIKVAKSGGTAEKLCNVAKNVDTRKTAAKKVIDKGTDAAKKMVDGTKNGHKVLEAATKAEKATDKLSEKAAKKIITKAGDTQIRTTVTKKATDYIADRSIKSKTVYKDAQKAAEKYTDKLMENIYSAPKDFVKGKAKEKAKKKIVYALDGGSGSSSW